MTERNEGAVTVTDDSNIDEIYLRVWEKQQEWTGTRWGVTTFFLSISFALFGLSLQSHSSPIAGTVQRIAGLAIYWFTYFLFRRYDDWSKFLRAYLEELETTTSTRFALQTRWKRTKQTGFRKLTSVNRLLIYFGVLYTVSVVVLWRLGF
jgi:hypothetical protein